MGELKDTDVAMAYLPPGWIGQNLFGYVQPMVVGYCICCPESSDTMLADMREMGPTYFLATPRVLETLAKQVSLRMEEAGGFNQRLYRYCMAVGRRVAARTLAGERLSIGDRLASMASDLLMRGPLRDVLGMSKVRVAYTAGDAVDPDLLMFFRALGINLKQLYGSTETGFFVALQRDGAVKPDTVGSPVEGVELKMTPQREILVRSPGLFREYHGDAATDGAGNKRRGLVSHRRRRLSRPGRAIADRRPHGPCRRVERRHVVRAPNCSKANSSSCPTSGRRWRSATGATWSARSSTSKWLPPAVGPTSRAFPIRDKPTSLRATRSMH